MESQDIIFFGKKIDKKSIENKVLNNIFSELSSTEDSKYRFAYDDNDSEHNDYSDYYDRSDCS